jgi:hypothetical protein
VGILFAFHSRPARALLFALDAPTEKLAFSIFGAVFSRSPPKVVSLSAAMRLDSHRSQ